jgi:hypothetical protein
MAPTPTAVQRLREVRKEWPEAVVLAEPLALAVRIEPELLRDVRLVLLPASHASLEADFYFSPLISQRTPEWLSIDPPLAHALQNRLAADIRHGGRDAERVRRMRAMVERAHSAVPFEIAREEQIIWMSVEKAGGKAEARRAVNEVLRDVLMRMLQGSDASTALARWFAAAAKRMPPLARETESFALLVFASSSILGGRKIEAQVNATLDTFEELARYLPQSAKRVAVWGALTTRGLHLRPERYAGYQQVEMPLTNPVLLEARSENGRPILVQVSPGEAVFEPLPAGVVTLRTLTRDLLTFRPRADISVVQKQLSDTAREYERLRATVPSGDERTGRMEVIVTKMRTLAIAGYPLLKEFAESSSPGDRLVAVVMLQVRPSPDYIRWLGARVSEERAFLRYHAAVALLSAARVLKATHHTTIREAIAAAQQALGTGGGTEGQLAVLKNAEKELALDSEGPLR